MPCSDFMGMESVVKLKVVSLHLNHGNWQLAFQEIFMSRIMKNTETQLALTNIELVLNQLVKICENESDLVKDRVCNKINIYSNDFCLVFLLISQRLSIHLS